MQKEDRERLEARAAELSKTLYTPPTRTRPPFILVHAAPGMGKSSLASEFPAPYFLYTEDPFPYRNKQVEGRFIRSWEELHEVLDELEELYEIYHQLGRKPASRTLVVDNVSGFDNLVMDHLERVYNMRSLGDLPYGQGWAALTRYWESRAGFEVTRGRLSGYHGILPRLAKFRDRYEMCVLLLAHSKTKTITSTLDKSFERACPHLSRGVSEVLTRFVDEIMYIYSDMTENRDGVMVKTGFQFKSGNGMPGYESKSRGGIPESLPYVPGEGFRALAPYLPRWYRPDQVPGYIPPATDVKEKAEGGAPSKGDPAKDKPETPGDQSDLSTTPQVITDNNNTEMN